MTSRKDFEGAIRQLAYRANVSAHAAICTPRPASISIGRRGMTFFSGLPRLNSMRRAKNTIAGVFTKRTR